MLSRLAFSRSLVALSVLAAGCAAGDGINNPAGSGAGGDAVGPGNGGADGSGGADPTSSSSSKSSSGSSTTSSSSHGGGAAGPGGGSPDGGAGPGGGNPDGGGPSAGGGGQGGDGGSPPLPACGDGERNGTEVCEGDDLDGESCETIELGFIGGELACTAGCAFDTSGCTAPPDCGNGVIEGVESCDGDALDGRTCQTEGFDDGTISCSGGCALDLSQCFTCGNDAIEAGELCDGSALGGATCGNLGHDGGTLGCNATCDGYDQAACSDCGDSQIESPEICDGNNFGGQTCGTKGFSGGTLSCTNNCTFIGTGNCYTCGNGVVTGAEICDGSALNGQTCITLGYEVGGTLGCNANCLSYNTSACIDSQCNDGIDNDGDGFLDFGDDLGCTSAIDASESQYSSGCAGNGNPIFDTGYPEFSYSFYQPFDTTGFPDTTDATCQGNTGPEIWFVYKNEQFQPDIYFYTRPPVGSPPPGVTSMTDTVITVFRGACNGTATCDDDSGSGNHAQVTLTNVNAGELIFVKVEGYSSQVGYGELVFDLYYNEAP